MIRLKIIIPPVLLFFNSCTKKNDIIIKVNNSTKRVEKTISPEKDVNYTTQRIEVKGYSDDSIYVKFGDGGRPFYLRNNIDTSFIGDYYGGDKVKFIFDPYKSKKRDLQITFRIL